jgi:hypothetical protein
MLSEGVSSVRVEKVSLGLNHFSATPIHTVRVTLRPLTSHDAPTKSVEDLQAQIGLLTAERQHLRSTGCDEGDLERNRLEIARLQWELSHALIGRHARTAAA